MFAIKIGVLITTAIKSTIIKGSRSEELYMSSAECSAESSACVSIKIVCIVIYRISHVDISNTIIRSMKYL